MNNFDANFFFECAFPEVGDDVALNILMIFGDTCQNNGGFIKLRDYVYILFIDKIWYK